jgi:DNA-binding IclR family transcriptional regulator
MAVFGADGRPVAGLTAAGPVQRMTHEWIRVMAAELRDPVAAASAELRQVGYRLRKY